jgi:excinuclease ABC subunit A
MRLKSCNQNNLKNLSFDLPKNGLILITGVSGAGKTSLGFDSIYAEGQHRYLDSLSPASKKWIKQLPRPRITSIEGLTPTLAVSERIPKRYGINTVASQSDLYELLAQIFTRLAIQHSPKTGKALTQFSIEEMLNWTLNTFPEGSRLQILSKYKVKKEERELFFKDKEQEGFVRFVEEGETISVIVDRIKIKEGIRERLSDSLRTALNLGKGVVWLQEGSEGPFHILSENYYCSDSETRYPKLKNNDFSFTSAQGACLHCQGRGGIDTIDQEKLFLEPEKPLQEKCLELLSLFSKKNHKLYTQLWLAFSREKENPELWKDFLEGSPKKLTLTVEIGDDKRKLQTEWKGFIHYVHLDLRKSSSRFNNKPYIDWNTCQVCSGERLKEQARYVYWQKKTLPQLCTLTISELKVWLNTLTLSSRDTLYIQDLLDQIHKRLEILERVGLSYLKLNQELNSLSTGENNRLHLSTQIAAKLSGMTYVFDEAFSGLHPSDRKYLIKLFKELCTLGNTVIVIEHDMSLLKEADWVLELGPEGGERGGYLLFEGTAKDYEKAETPTTEAQRTPLPKGRPTTQKKLIFGPVSTNNLKDVLLELPLHALVGVCGVSGAGKSSLFLDSLAPALQDTLNGHPWKTPKLSGCEEIVALSLIDTRYLRSIPRSTLASFLQLTLPIRKLLVSTKLAQARGLNTSYFALNKKGARCETCEGLGRIKLSMPLLPDTQIICSQCEGKRYHREALQIQWQGHSIAELEKLNVSSAMELFSHHKEIIQKLEFLKTLGLEYLHIGQSFDTLSQGELQRIKLAAELSKPKHQHCLYIFDEPSMGLHLQEVSLLLYALRQLIEQGHSVVILEHHCHLLSACDHLIEMGPTGGQSGGHLIFSGSVKECKKTSSPTSHFLL